MMTEQCPGSFEITDTALMQRQTICHVCGHPVECSPVMGILARHQRPAAVIVTDDDGGI